jgi:diguanylate cyclase (GGDEF)-like protein
MTPAGQNQAHGNPWGSLDPYSQLVRALLPRATSINVFDGAGALRWSSDTTTGPDLIQLIDSTLEQARADTQSPGALEVLDGSHPIYMCWLRDDTGQLLAIVAIACRPGNEPRPFSFVHSLLRPALECMRRDLLAHAAIEALHGTVSALDQDVELLLADAGAEAACGGPDELKHLVQGAVEHLKCAMGALIVPEKSLALMRSARDSKADGTLLARTHRHLVSMAQMRPEPTLINRIAPSPSLGIIPYRILSCPVRQGSGRTVGVLALFRDQSGPEFEQRDARLAEGLARRAAMLLQTYYDAQTGLYTRAALEQRMRAMQVEGAAALGGWSVLYIDLDQLHVINESCGMHVGDAVIAQLGELIRRRLPPGALAARLSGDRLAVLLPSAVDDAASFAESLRAGAEQLGEAQAEARPKISISVGVASLASSSQELVHALVAAETACKSAKELGRNQVAVHDAADATLVGRFTGVRTATRLRQAMAEERMRLAAQLILPFDPGAALRPHYEILVRMIGEDGATIGPDNFLAAASRYQLTSTIDRWVIERAVALLGTHSTTLTGRPAVFALNCSSQSLADEAFGDFIERTLDASGLEPGAFSFEFAESAAIAHIERAELLFRRLRRLGCGIALDDFGSGLSSLGYLRRLPVTVLKIDGSFVRDVLRDPRAESMVRSLAQLARGMSIETVAEYVETDEIRARVAMLGVDYGQGFSIGRPESFDEVLARLPVLAAAAPAYGVAGESAPLPGTVSLQ